MSILKINNKLYLIFYWIISIFFVLVAVLSVYGLDPGFNPYDSPTYFEFNLINPVRLPIITVIYSSLKYFDIIILFQITINCLAWIFCVSNINLLIKLNISKICLALTLYSLALTSPLLEQHTILMSESLSISFLILSLGAYAKYLTNSSDKNLLILLIFLILFAGIKISNSYIVFLIVVIVFVVNLIRRQLASNILQFIYLTITLLAILFLIFIGGQARTTLNLVNITNIIERSFDDTDVKKWYIDKGFPSIAYTQYVLPQDQPPIEMVISTPQVKKWMQDGGENLVLHYIYSNPFFTLFGPIKPSLFLKNYTDFESIYPHISMGTINQNNTNLFSTLNGITMDRSPDYLRALESNRLPFWSSNKLSYGLFPGLLLLLILIQLTIGLKKDQYSSLNTFVNYSFLLAIVGIWSNWHFTLNYDMQRYLLPWSLLLRIIALTSFIALMERLSLNKFN